MSTESIGRKSAIQDTNLSASPSIKDACNSAKKTVFDQLPGSLSHTAGREATNEQRALKRASIGILVGVCLASIVGTCGLAGILMGAFILANQRSLEDKAMPKETSASIREMERQIQNLEKEIEDHEKNKASNPKLEGVSKDGIAKCNLQINNFKVKLLESQFKQKENELKKIKAPWTAEKLKMKANLEKEMNELRRGILGKKDLIGAGEYLARLKQDELNQLESKLKQKEDKLEKIKESGLPCTVDVLKNKWNLEKEVKQLRKDITDLGSSKIAEDLEMENLINDITESINSTLPEDELNNPVDQFKQEVLDDWDFTMQEVLEANKEEVQKEVGVDGQSSHQVTSDIEQEKMEKLDSAFNEIFGQNAEVSNQKEYKLINNIMTRLTEEYSKKAGLSPDEKEKLKKTTERFMELTKRPDFEKIIKSNDQLQGIYNHIELEYTVLNFLDGLK